MYKNRVSYNGEIVDSVAQSPSYSKAMPEPKSDFVAEEGVN